MIDLLLLALLAGAAYLGWRRGLVVTLLAAGVFVAVGLPVAAVAAAIGTPPAIIAFTLGGAIGLVPLALRLEAVTATAESLLSAGLRRADRIGGALLNIGFALCGAWFVAALVSIVPHDSALLSVVRSSPSLGALVESVPPQGGLGVVVLRSGLVPGLNGPLVLAEEPDPASADSPAVRAARASVLQIRGTACNRVVKGTAWVAGAGLVLTNAHVVAGHRRTFVAAGPAIDGTQGTVTAFDPVNDVAVVSVDPSVLPPALPISTRIVHGDRAAVIGFPFGGEQRIVSARIDRVATYDVEPLGGGSAVGAEVLAFRADVEPGNSGGPVVAEDGSVLGMVVAKGLGQRTEAAYGVAGAVLERALAQGAARQPASTGSCLDEDDLAPGRGSGTATNGER